MRAGAFAVFSAALFAGSLLLTGSFLSAQSPHDRVVRLAELEIDPSQLDRYNAALRDEISASIRIEPGVLALFAVSVKDHPTQIRLFEMYANSAAYESHLQSPHFKKYKADTAGMVKSLKLVETEPLLLGAK
jgi:quinol monooxygenase YgiN